MSKSRGLGRVYQPTYKDKKTGERRTLTVWWVQYNHRGRMLRESSHSEVRADAVRLLKQRLGEIGRGQPLVGPDVEKTTFAQLAEMLVNDYRINGRRSLDRITDAIAHLREAFGGDRATTITGDRVAAYVVARQGEGAANATINRELAALKRMFRLGEDVGKVVRRARVPLLKENNARKGFFEEPDFRRVVADLPEHLRSVFEVAYITGWRIRSEILTRQRHHVDLRAGWLRLEPGETKNSDGRMFPLTETLRAVLERQLAATHTLEKATGQIIPWLFHRDGKPIKSLRRAWLTACKLAGLRGKIPHDLRRTAVRNLERAGVPRSAAMKMVGHRTAAIYSRYAIADEQMLREAATKLEAHHAAERDTRPVVLALGRSGRSGE